MAEDLLAVQNVSVRATNVNLVVPQQQPAAAVAAAVAVQWGTVVQHPQSSRFTLFLSFFFVLFLTFSVTQKQDNS
jgi:hypothetical protein